MAYQSSANASNGAEKILINGALDVLAKILLWVKEKYLAASVGTDFLEVSLSSMVVYTRESSE